MKTAKKAILVESRLGSLGAPVITIHHQAMKRHSNMSRQEWVFWNVEFLGEIEPFLIKKYVACRAHISVLNFE